MKKNQGSRRAFLNKLAGVSTVIATTPSVLSASQLMRREILVPAHKLAASDTIQIAIIGAGIMGTEDTKTALQIPGVKLVAAADLYDGHLKRAKEVWGKDIFTTRDYREILNRKDVDAVIVATPDHWHQKISIDALNSGKAVYSEKPMVHKIEEGYDLIETQKKTKKAFQVGSQGLSSLCEAKAKELFEKGEIGELNYVEGFWARQSPMGAWQYSIPPDASKDTVDWDRFLGNAPKIPYDPIRFFRWRNYRDYGTGVSGDLFVHLFSSLHYITSSKGPNKIVSTGGLRYWKDGRQVPDVLLGMFDYPKSETHPAFNLSLRVNFVDGTSGSTFLRLVGSEGAMDVGEETVTVKRSKMPEAPGYMIHTFDEGMQKEFVKRYEQQYPQKRKAILPPNETTFTVEKGYKGAHYDHFSNFFEAIRTGKPVVEDATFGLRAAAPALACNNSYFEEKIIKWNPDTMKLA